MPKLTNTKRIIIRRAVLRSLKYAGAQLIELAAIPLMARYKGMFQLRPVVVQKIINSLVHEGELERRGKDKYYLTDLGAVRLLPVLRLVKATDGNTRILVFDIPESRRKLRDRFRYHIKLLGFKRHQQSVWVSQYQCEDWIEWLIGYHQVGDFVSLYIGRLVR
ncbi:TPA: CRISPR-associated endonuclease Cas2 [Patescibacteria group bacterium]|uniref:Repressor in ring oxydation complex/ phenylacetic acid degradation pathway related protein (PaaX) n=2 Tax=Bacteria division Kazan-3B-28 TaxID=1798534 RepID=A0A0G1X6B0_UNCK3|nr:MAG: repressor in ring oxydation complex/phenylacetic acid degradation pathway-like protein (paaX), phenylacetic acid degradation operon negative regulatory protein [candidate division Kazan bacterium GW2011_GWA1_50_15]KKW25371.1 MAG: Repressor in ring oxydation complex/ phenylacetic acid degradation pathway related protein (PaaX) [candidate division Kazan bacterium GW2011_GWC1_52_13]KKW26678.1 MAG: Repressor in ring oxydation complex/ phenylacetic acid degradation pathway related protein (Paa